MEIKVDLPYPSLEGITEDYRSLRIISPAYAGGKGELTAILQYVYQSVLLGETGRKKQSQTLIGIAVNEMHHLELLGTAITRLGAPPIFTGCPPYPVGYYSASCVNYNKVPKEMFAIDALSERAAIDEYRRILCKLDNPPLSALIERIIKDEELHLSIFEKMAKEECESALPQGN